MTTTTLYKIIQSELFKQGFNREIVDDNGNLIYFDREQKNMTKIMKFDDDVKKIIDSLFMNNLKVDEHDRHFKKAFMFKFLNRQINKQTVESFKFDLISTFMSNEDYINRVYNDMNKYLHRVSESESDMNTNNTSSETGKSVNNSTSSETGKSVNSGENTSTQRDNSTSKSDNESTDRKASSNLPNSTLSFNLDDESFSNPSTADAGRTKGKANTVNTGNTESTQLSKGNNSDERLSESNGINTDERNAESKGDSHQNTLSRVYTLDELFKTTHILDNIYRKFDEKCFLQTW